MEPDDLPKYDDLLTSVLTAVRNLGGSGTIGEINEHVFSASGLPDEALEVTYERSGAAIFPDRCSWARSYLKLAGLLTSGGRGVWVLTEEGSAILLRGDDAIRRTVAEAYAERAAYYRERRAARDAAEPQVEEDGENAPIAESEAAQAEILNEPNAVWTERLLEILHALPPDAFERLCKRLLREAGFTSVEVSGQTGDGGIDGYGVLRVNLVSFKMLFQAKRWQGAVGAPVVRDFRGAMIGRADKGLIITTSNFTRAASDEATRDGAPTIDLINGEDLCQLLKETGIGVSVKMVEEVTIDPTVFAAI